MRTILYCSIVFLLAAAILSSAEPGTLSGPVSGFVFDSATHSVRSIVGVPGAAYVSSDIVSGVDAARMSPDGKMVAVLRAGSLLIMRSGTDGWLSTVIAEGLRDSGAIAWSADSLYLAVAEGSGLVRLLKTDGTVIASRSLPGTAISLAASGAHVLAAVKSDAGSGVFLVSRDEVRLIAPAEDPSAVALAGEDLYFCDRARGEVWALRGYAGGGVPLLAAKVDDPVGVSADREKRLLFISSAAGRRAFGLRLDSFEPSFDLPLEFEPSGMEAFGSSGWLLNAGAPGPLQLLAVEDAPAVYFIPREERH